MDGRVFQVNLSPGGVPKLPVEQARVGLQGLDGDAHHHDHVHGGPHRAVCLLAIEAIERVQADGHAIEPGAVGENLTTAGIELSMLPVGTRLAVGSEVLLEISGPANPCDVIKHVFQRGKSGRISILLHPTDSRMYARVLAEGTVHEGDAIRVLPPVAETMAPVHQLLDLLEAVEREAWLSLWRAAESTGVEIRIVDRGDLTMAACPSVPGSAFNRAFGIRQVPIALPEVFELYRSGGTIGWIVAGAGEAPWPGALGEEPTGVHAATIEAALERAASVPVPDGVTVRAVDPADADDVERWTGLVVDGFGLEGRERSVMAATNRALAHARGEHGLIASLHGVDVAAAASFTRRRVAWLGGAAVLPEARGHGLQRVLLAERIRRAADAGCHRVMATADLGSISAGNLETLGLARIWTREHYRFDPATTGDGTAPATATGLRA